MKTTDEIMRKQDPRMTRWRTSILFKDGQSITTVFDDFEDAMKELSKYSDKNYVSMLEFGPSW